MASRTPRRGGGKFNTGLLRISNKLFTPSSSVKKVSFSNPPEVPQKKEEKKDNITPGTPRRSVKSVRKYPLTPHPNPPVAVTTPKKKKKSASPVKAAEKEEAPQKRRKSKKSSFTLFSNTSTVTARPSNTLTAQLSYTLETLPSKINALKKDVKSCYVEKINALEKLEDDLLKRLEKVSNMKLNNAEEALVDKKYEVIEEMEEKILAIQKLKESKEIQLEEIRPGLRANHNQRFVCCPICAKNE